MNIEKYIAAGSKKPYTYRLAQRGTFGKHVYIVSFEDTQIRTVRMVREDVESYVAALNGAWMLGWNDGFAVAGQASLDLIKESSWKGEVDRQGGSFTQDELNARETW